MACWVGFAAITWAVTTGHTAAFDKAGLLFWRGDDLRPAVSQHPLELVRALTAFGGVVLRDLIALGATVALMIGRRRRAAFQFAVTVISGSIVNTVLKNIVGRARPDIVPHLVTASGYSFPSGHSFNSAVIYIAMALAFAALSERRSVRRIGVVSAVALSLAIAWSRVWLGVHWPSDAIAGWLGGAGWACLAHALLSRKALPPDR